MFACVLLHTMMRFDYVRTNVLLHRNTERNTGRAAIRRTIDPNGVATQRNTQSGLQIASGIQAGVHATNSEKHPGRVTTQRGNTARRESQHS